MGKSTDTWMPLYISDWEGDTAHLTCEEDGAYSRLVRWYWRNGPLPDDERKLGSIIRDHRLWKKVQGTILPFFFISNGQWRHKRIDAELAKASRITTVRKAAGKEGAARRWGNVVPLDRDRE